MLPPALPIGWPSRTSAVAPSVKIDASRSAHVNTSGRLTATIAAASPPTIASDRAAAGAQKAASRVGQSAREKGPTEPMWEGRGVADGSVDGAIVAAEPAGVLVDAPHAASATLRTMAGRRPLLSPMP